MYHYTKIISSEKEKTSQKNTPLLHLSESEPVGKYMCTSNMAEKSQEKRGFSRPILDGRFFSIYSDITKLFWSIEDKSKVP